MKVGITGQPGFVGTHLYNFLSLKQDEIELIPFEDDFFKDDVLLTDFVSKCDTIVHLAAMNRTKGAPEEIYECNIRLVKDILNAVEKSGKKPHIIFSSSLQEERDNPYGKSKKEGRMMFNEWAKKNNAKFSGLIIPNVFGPFGAPYYNSVIATFSYQVTHNMEPKIEIDAELSLIYINDLVKVFYDIITCKETGNPVTVQPDYFFKVTDILSKIRSFKETYMDRKLIPELKDKFEVQLFNTFRTYIDYDFYPVKLTVNTDDRGYLFETVKSFIGGQTFYSVSKPGIVRGNHFHTRKIERFCVIEGEAIIRLRRVGTDKVIEYSVTGKEPSFVDIPVFHTHNIENTGKSELKTFFWTNELFDTEDSDTYFQKV